MQRRSTLRLENDFSTAAKNMNNKMLLKFLNKN